MGYRWIYSITVRTLLLVGGVVLVTLGIVYGKGGLLVAGLLLCAASIFIFRKMQQQLREKSWLMLYADPNLIRQVLINLIKNAVQAIGGEKGRIHVRAYSSADEHVFVYVSNDGPAIPEVEAEQIFVPFFTTRSEGSGIGLSLSRQIMKLSGGSVSLLRPGTNGWNTTFVLEFE